MSTKEASLYLDTDGDIESIEEEQVQWYRFDQDGPDGRDGWGGGRKIHKIKSAHTTEEDIDKRVLNGSVMLNLIYGMDGKLDEYTARKESKKTQNDLSAVFSHLWNQEHERQKAVMEQSGRVSETARQLAVSAQAHLTRRDSTDGMSIMAGFPIFCDWGRDTMIAFFTDVRLQLARWRPQRVFYKHLCVLPQGNHAKSLSRG